MNFRKHNSRGLRKMASSTTVPEACHETDLKKLLSPLQIKANARNFPPVPENCLVTGGTGFVGQRVCEMLVERGAKVRSTIHFQVDSCLDLQPMSVMFALHSLRLAIVAGRLLRHCPPFSQCLEKAPHYLFSRRHHQEGGCDQSC